jgi:hypothetical protein
VARVSRALGGSAYDPRTDTFAVRGAPDDLVRRVEATVLAPRFRRLLARWFGR